MSKSRLLSGKVPKKSGLELDSSRYEFLDLANAEPDLGLPALNGSILVSLIDGTRVWTNNISVDLTGNIAVGTISTADGSSSIAILDSVIAEENLAVRGIFSAPLISTQTINTIDSSNLRIESGLIVEGDLTVQGTTTTINSTTLAIEDKNIELAKGATTAAEADGAGITVLGPTISASLLYDAATDSWLFNKDIRANLIGSATGNIFTSLIDSLDSSAVTFVPQVVMNSDLTVENNVYVDGDVTATNFNGTLKGNVIVDSGISEFNDIKIKGVLVGDVLTAITAGNLTGDVLAPNGVKVLENGTDGTDAEFTGTVIGNVFTNLINSFDSSAVRFVPQVLMNSDLTVENNAYFQNDVTAQKFIGFLEGQVSDITNHSIGELSDVDISILPLNNQTLIWNALENKFVPGDSFSQADFDTAFGNKSIGDLSDVDITSVPPTNGQALIWNDLSGKFVPGQPLGVGDDVAFASITGNIFTNLIDSPDSSAITMVPQVIMNSDLNVENNVYVTVDVTARKFLGDLYAQIVKSTFGEFDTITVNGVQIGAIQGSTRGNLIGDIFSENSIKILENGTDGTDAVFTGSVIGNVTGQVSDISNHSIDGLSDVDTTTVAPSNGQTLVWNAASNKFIPGGQAIGTTDDVTFNSLTLQTLDVVTIGSPDSTSISVVNSTVFASDVTVDNNLVVQGNLTVLGTETIINSESLVVSDPIIYFAEDNQANVFDIGIVGSFNNGVYQHTGLIRDASDNIWRLFSNYIPEPEEPLDFNGVTYDDLKLGVLIADQINSTYIYGQIITNLIDSSDSSPIIVTPKLITSTDLEVQGKLTVGTTAVITESVSSPKFIGNLEGNVTGQISDISNHYLNDLADVDLDIIPPQDLDILTWNAGVQRWVAAGLTNQGLFTDSDVTFNSLTATIYTNTIYAPDSGDIVAANRFVVTNDLVSENNIYSQNDIIASGNVQAINFVGYLEGTARDIDDTALTNKEFITEVDVNSDLVFIYDESSGELKKTFVSEIAAFGQQGYTGSIGFTGSQGEIGFTGSQGEIGFTGSQGEIGFTGSQGERGVAGSSVTIKGSVATPQDLVTPYLGDIGDGYIVESDGNLYIWDGAEWDDVGQIVGPQGFTGSQGEIGYTGSQGDLGYTGSQGESTFTWGEDPPVNPAVGDRWFNTSESLLLVYVDDSDSQQWVEVAASGFMGQTGYTGSGAYPSLQNNSGAVLTNNGNNVSWSQGAFMFRNKIINGNFDIWQRGTSQTSSAYGSADRWYMQHSGSTKTASQQAFTLGQTDVPNNPKYFMRHVVTSVAGASNFVVPSHRIEGVETLSGKTVTLSFWAKADDSKNIAIEFSQYFGTGGSPSTQVNEISSQLVALTTSWTKYTITVDIPSISGKTLGTNDNDFLQVLFWFDAGSNYAARTANLGQQSGTFDIAQVQLEEGSVATPFEQRPNGTELSLCTRYFYRMGNGVNLFLRYATGDVRVSNGLDGTIHLPNVMRATPTATISSAAHFAVSEANVNRALTSLTISTMPVNCSWVFYSASVASGLTPGRSGQLISNNTTASFIDFSAEL